MKKTGVKTTIICPNAINTGMFDGISMKLQWIVPILNTEDVALSVVQAIKTERVS
jgi:short-subunit dehydrogenase